MLMERAVSFYQIQTFFSPYLVEGREEATCEHDTLLLD